MILQKLKASVSQAGVISCTDLAKQYGISPDGIDAMMATWVNRGDVVRQCVCHDQQTIQYRLAHKDEIQCLSII
ncbi:FeoC-like transcriptional regulator [Salinivibrio kushneri]|uniref:FeoC-like transcriptional regulator n=1 Tax=Salinivibrio kushneri TaxID=1908198 RepID=A0AA47LQK4_9GAMM|nr:FeoC-like transcriptional regulator [Salinivibrio kushneri]WBA07804.1 FeoC-like transcriptional regulator [Salinivibrio kushneri]